jgi:cystathionine gamma-synthase
VKVRLIQYLICLGDKQKHKVDATGCDWGPAPSPSRFAELHIVLFPADALPLAKECWQHTGMGISSRYAEYCLSLIPEESVQPPSSIVSHPEKGHNEHYLENCLVDCVGRNMSSSQPICSTGDLGYDMSNYLEERHGYAVLTGSGAVAKRALRRRIADALARNVPEDIRTAQCATDQAVEIGPKSRGAKDVTEDDVFLFPTGMCAIWNAYDLLTMTRPAAKTICFGYVPRYCVLRMLKS